jgi:hypothetical protein
MPAMRRGKDTPTRARCNDLVVSRDRVDNSRQKGPVHGELLNPRAFLGMSRSCQHGGVRDLAVLFLHLLTTVTRLAGSGGLRSGVAESLLVKHQLLILNRSRKRSPNRRFSDRAVAGLVCAPYASAPADPFRNRPQSINAFEASPSFDTAEISAALLIRRGDQAGTEGTQPRSRGSSRRHETAKSHLGAALGSLNR